MGVTGMFQHMMQFGLLLSCDDVLKSDWFYLELSGSGSNSLNSRNLPGCFPYGLGTRLGLSTEGDLVGMGTPYSPPRCSME